MRSQNGYETVGRCQELWELDESFEASASSKRNEFIDCHIPSAKIRKGRGKGKKAKEVIVR